VCRKRLLWIALLVVFAGCSRSELVPLTGKLTLDGAPLPTAIITFSNTTDGPSGYGSVEPDGDYFAKTGSQAGLMPGDYRISVVAHEPEVVTNRSIEKVPKTITPARYASPETSGLRYTLTSAGGAFDIALESK
jgi:hypothetical protein